MDDAKIYPLGESAAIVEFGTEISEQTNRRVIAFTDHLNKNPFEGLIEAVPAYSSAAIYYDIAAVTKRVLTGSTALEAVTNLLNGALREITHGSQQEHSIFEIPTLFSSECGLDLELVATTCDVTADDIVEIFATRTYRVFMIGFLPGFAYMGSVDERIRVPRRQQPRSRVPRGSVAIAGEQCGIYPFDTPGGWNIIGRTDVQFFRPHNEQPSLLKAGDLVRFVPT
jgi:inhibitor of KinA